MQYVIVTKANKVYYKSQYQELPASFSIPNLTILIEKVSSTTVRMCFL